VPSSHPRSESPQKLAALQAVSDVDGWLLPEDVFKLYDLASAAAGPILEIGTYHGRSTIVMALALKDAGNPVPLVSLDVDPEALHAAGENARRKGVAGRITLVRGTAAAFFRATTGFVPAVVFVDGDHSAAGAARDLRVLEPHVADGGLLFL
jgi:predicted O-methyltransferase YrrM